MASRQKAVEPPAPLRIERSGGRVNLHLEGVVSVAFAGRMLEAARDVAAEPAPTSVHCEHLQHIDCAGVQVLLSLHEVLRTKGFGLALTNVPDSVAQTLRVAGLSNAF